MLTEVIIRRNPDEVVNNLHNDALFTLYNNTDNTKQAQFDLSSLTAAEVASIPLQSTGYIHLSLWEMFQTGQTDFSTAIPFAGAGAATRLTGAEAASAYSPVIYSYYYTDPVGGCLRTSDITTSEDFSVWHASFRLPADYVVGTDLTVSCKGLSTKTNGASAPPIHSVRMYARRDAKAADRGLWCQEIGGDAILNANICLTLAQTLDVVEEAATPIRPPVMLGHNLSFTIDSDDADYPLAANSYILLNFDSRSKSAGAAEYVSNWFSNFYVTYTKRFYL